MNTITITEESFRHWLRQQPRSREFKYNSTTNCPIASFLREELDAEAIVGSCHISFLNFEDMMIPDGLVAGIDKARRGCGLWYSGMISVKALRRVFLPWRGRIFGWMRKGHEFKV